MSAKDSSTAPRHPALAILASDRWDDAFGVLHHASEHLLGDACAQALLDKLGDRDAVRDEIMLTVDALYGIGTIEAGNLALAWSMLTCDPRKPDSFNHVLPQLQHTLDTAGLDPEGDADLSRRLRCWWEACDAKCTGSAVSIFCIAAIAAEDGVDDLPDPEPVNPKEETEPVFLMNSSPLLSRSGPSLVVLSAAKASRLNAATAAYKDLIGVALPLVVVRERARIQAALYAEFPHATVAIDLLMRDLRQDKTAKIAPVCLYGPPGSGKSRLVRRISDLLLTFLYRFDAGSSTDAHFSGVSKSWSNTEPSVPMRAVLQSRTASPWILLDEVDKAGTSNHNGSLFHALLPFLDVETSSRHRDQSLDSEVDLSSVSYACTANSVEKLPSPLRDRLRMINVPAPSLAYLPALAASVMRDLAAQDEARSGDAPMAGDELAVIGKAWVREQFSMRGLRKMVSATLEARDQCSMRH